MNGNEGLLAEEIVRHRLLLNHETDEAVQCLQLKELSERELRLSKLLSARAATTVVSTGESWSELILIALKENGTNPNLKNKRHSSALNEQSKALEQLTTRKLSVLVGRAGTGKTTVLAGPIEINQTVDRRDFVFSAYWKSAFDCHKKANTNAMTVAQFLHQLKRYDGFRQRVLFEGEEKV